MGKVVTYEVIKPFTDLNDSGHVYNRTNLYPRAGRFEDEARIELLASSDNKQGVPLIKKVVKDESEYQNVPRGTIEQEPETEQADDNVEGIVFEELTLKQLHGLAKDFELTGYSSMNKKELVKLLNELE